MAHQNRVSGDERIFPVTKQAKGIFFQLCTTRKILSRPGLYTLQGFAAAFYLLGYCVLRGTEGGGGAAAAR